MYNMHSDHCNPKLLKSPSHPYNPLILQVPFPHCFLFGFAFACILRPAELNQDPLSDHGLGTIHWMLMHSSLGTQLKTITVFPPESIHTQSYSEDGYYPKMLSQVHDWLVTGPVLSSPSAGSHCCEAMSYNPSHCAMPRREHYRVLLLNSGSYILYMPASRMIFEP